MLVLVADTQMIGAGSREGGGCRAWAGVVVYGRGLSCMEGSGACQRRKGCIFERTGARVEKRDAQRVRTYLLLLDIVLVPLKRRLESHVRRHRARWGWRRAARCELRLKRGGKRAPRGQHQRDRKQTQHPDGGRLKKTVAEHYRKFHHPPSIPIAALAPTSFILAQLAVCPTSPPPPSPII